MVLQYSFHNVFYSESRMIAPTMFMINRTYTIVYRNAIYTLFMFILPFTILTWVNCRIVAVLKLSKYIRRKMTNRTATDEASCTSLTVKSPNHLTVDMNKNKEAKTLKEIRKGNNYCLLYSSYFLQFKLMILFTTYFFNRLLLRTEM